MYISRAAFAAAFFCLCVPASADAGDVVTLDEAFRRVVDSHPDFAVMQKTEIALAAETERAAQRPALTLGVTAENMLGTGGFGAADQAELTLSLASVIEHDDRRHARLAIAGQRLEGAALLREGKRLDLMAEVARRYLDAVAARAVVRLGREDLTQRQRLVQAAELRVRAGGAPALAKQAATTASARAQIALASAERHETYTRRRLAALWGGSDSQFMLAPADLIALPIVPSYDEAVRNMANTPVLRQFAHESRLREARVQLARSARLPQIQWQLGVRRLQAEQDWALVGGVSFELGAARRADPDIRAAAAELAAVEFERDSQQRVLEATLVEAWSQLDSAVAAARQIDTLLMPALHRTLQSAEQAFRAGASSQFEWTQVQNDIAATQRDRIDTSVAAYRALIELQRLTGERFDLAAGTDREPTP
jgi:cobalt-zinc-cadmium efflux system outer membrane protein